MVKKPIQPIVFVTYENERISIKNSLPFIKCVLRLFCVVHGPGGGGTPIHCLYRYVPPNGVLFLKLLV